MNTFYDQFQRCIRHPQQRIVGVCSSCLHERLTCLIQPIAPSPPPTARKGSHVHPPENIELSHASLPRNAIDGAAETAPCRNADVHMRGQATICTQTGSSSSMGARSRENVRDLRTQTAQQVCHSSDLANAASYLNQSHREAKEALVEDKPSNAQHGWGEVSVSSKGDAIGKKKASWFSASKSKTSLHTMAIQVDDRKSTKYALKSPQHTRASVRQAVGSSSDAHRHVRTSDLEAIAETNTGDASRKIQNHVSREAGMSTSWISSLFHRRRGSRSRSNLSNSSGSSVTNMDAGINTGIASNESNRHSPKNSIDAGRLSWDGARPNFKQLLKRVEARNKQQRADFSPLQFVDYAMKEYNDNGREAVNQTPHLQKSKSVASARSSISVEMPKDLMQSSFTPMMPGQSNVMVGLEYDSQSEDRNLRRSRSWGRTWNRALSPLWGSRSNRYKGITHESPSSAHHSSHFHAGLVTPSHVNGKGLANPASSSHLSPLRRSKLAPDARIHLAHGKTSCNAT